MTLSIAMRTDILRRNGGFYPNHIDAGEELVWGQMFLEARAGLINEKCASYLFHTHPTARYSAGIDIDFSIQGPLRGDGGALRCR